MSASSEGKATAPAGRTEDLKKRSMAEAYSGWPERERRLAVRVSFSPRWQSAA